MNRQLLAWAALVLTASMPPAWAQDPVTPTPPANKRAEAERLFEAGRVHYEANRFHESIEQFEKAYALANDPVYLFNIAQAYRNAADCLKARDYYARYMAEAPAPENIESVRSWLRVLEPCALTRKREQERLRRADELERNHQQAQAQAQASGSATPVELVVDDGRNERLAGIAVAGAGAVGIIVGIVYGVKSQSYENEISLACSTQCQWDALEARHDAGRRANVISLIGYIGGGLAVVGGGALYMYGRSKVTMIDASPTNGGAQITARIRF